MSAAGWPEQYEFRVTGVLDNRWAARFDGLSKEAAMITHTTIQALGQARLADMHDQARRAALARAVRQARRTRRQRSRAGRPGALLLRRITSAGRPRRAIRDG